MTGFGRLSLQSLGLLILRALLACSAQPENGLPGSCPLSCGNAKLGGKEMIIRPISGGDYKYTCAGGNFVNGARPLPGPIIAQFGAYQPAVPDLRVKSATTTTTNGAGGTGTPGDAEIPVANVSFEPVIQGNMDANSTHPDNASVTTSSVNNVNVTVVSPFRFSGVMTPKAQWCSDACGVMTLEVMPLCIFNRENPVEIRVHSGAAVAPVAHIVTISHTQ